MVRHASHPRNEANSRDIGVSALTVLLRRIQAAKAGTCPAPERAAPAQLDHKLAAKR